MKVLIEKVIEKVNDVEVEKEIRLESDEYQFTLRKYNGKVSTDKDGKEREIYETLGYYSNIHSALKDVLRMKIKESTATNLQELSEDIRRIEEWIKAKFEVELRDGERIAV